MILTSPPPPGASDGWAEREAVKRVDQLHCRRRDQPPISHSVEVKELMPGPFPDYGSAFEQDEQGTRVIPDRLGVSHVNVSVNGAVCHQA